MVLRPVLLALSLILLTCPASAQHADREDAAVQVAFDLRNARDGKQISASGRLVLEPQRGSAEAVVLEVQDGRAAPVGLSNRTPWLLRAELTGFWTFPVVLNLQPGEKSRRHTAEFWPTVEVTGQFVPPGRERLPSSFKVRMEVPVDPKRRDEVPVGGIACSVGDENRFRCQLPADTLDLSFRVPGYAAVWQMGLAVRPSGPLDLGKVVLKRGARLTGSVHWEGEPGGEGDSFGTARLRPILARGAASEVVVALGARRYETALSAAGTFDLSDLEAGRYVLEVERPGYSTARVPHLVLGEGEQRLLPEPLVLYRPVVLEIRVLPALDSNGEPWTVELVRTVGAQDETDPGRPSLVKTDPEGRALFSARAPGHYDIGVIDSRENRVHSEMAAELGGAGPSEKLIEIELIRVRGRLFHGSDAVAGTLWFGGRNGLTRARMVAAEDGRFTGELAEPGRWRVEIELAEKGVSVERRVKIEEPTDGRTEVEIRLPRTAVEGVVVDDRGEPRGGAEVVMMGASGSRRTQSNGRGEFQLDAVDPGPVELSARLRTAEGSWTSNTVHHVVRETESLPRVELRLTRKKKLEGQLLSALGPVAGATVTISTVTPSVPWGDSAASNLEGKFQTEVPAAAERLAVVAVAPGHGLKAFEVAAGRGPVQLELPFELGRLELVLPFSSREANDGGFQLQVYQNEILIPTGTLWNWASLHGEPPSQHSRVFVVPALAPGSYRACVVVSEELFSTGGGGDCQQGFLQGGGMLRLNFRERP